VTVIPRRLERWLRSLDGAPPLAVITASSVHALTFARSLGRRGVPVLLADSDRQLAVYSRFVRTLDLPDPEDCPREWVDALTALGACRPERAALIPTADAHAVLLAHHRGALASWFRFLLPEPATLERLADKREQLRCAEEAGLLVPTTHDVESPAEARLIAGTVRYPCVVKPCRSRVGRTFLGGAKLVVAASPEDLIRAYDAFRQHGVPALIQEVVPGGDDRLVSYLGLWDDAGREVAWLTKRKLRQFPPGFGNGSLQVSERLPAIAELSRRLLRHVGYRGLANLEFKLDERCGEYRLIEINPRGSAMTELAVRSGLDLPWLTYALLTGGETSPPPALEWGRRCVNEEWDLQAFLALRGSAGMTLAGWLRSLAGAGTVVGAWDDPLPLLGGMARGLKRLVSRGARRAARGGR
jgi:D-aspartate ligase